MHRPHNITIGAATPIMLAATAAAMANIGARPIRSLERDGNGWRVVGALAMLARKRHRGANTNRGKRGRR